jgi:hypothetical protein
MNSDSFELEISGPGDLYRDFCLWDYSPAALVTGKLRSINLLHASFAAAGDDGALRAACNDVRTAVGDFNTVWGVKLVDGRLSWELYFYDYRRQQRKVSIPRVLAALDPDGRCDLSPPEGRPYFLFSIDLDADLVSGRRSIEQIDIYLGNVGSSLSSGICYGLTAAGLDLRNFYFFFDFQRQRDESLDKIAHSAFVDPQFFDPDSLVWPELRCCSTLVVANKRTNDAVYFTRVGVDALLSFLQRLDYPRSLVEFVISQRGRLDHLRYDLALDFRMEEGQMNLLKSSFYGYF